MMLTADVLNNAYTCIKALIYIYKYTDAVSLCLSVSVCLSRSLCVSVCLSVSLSLSLSLSRTRPHTHTHTQPVDGDHWKVNRSLLSSPGLTLSISQPCFHSPVSHPERLQLMGMVGVDLHMEDIVQDITYYNNNDQSYAFLITTHGERSLSAVEPPSSQTDLQNPAKGVLNDPSLIHI